MMTKVLTMLLVVAGFALGGCTTLTEYGSVRKEVVRNDQGHVIGHKELLRNEQTGEVIARVSIYTAMLDSNGALIGYEEQAKGGSIIRDLQGRGIGSRFNDLRSRKSMAIVFLPSDAERVAVAPAKIWQLMASLSASDLRRIQ
jgi:hypothetical protein